MDIFLLIAGFALILVGANYLTDGAASIAERLHVSEFIIGLTIIAAGTSMPEFIVSFISALQGNSDIAIGNIVGSNIFNVFIILGICATIHPILISKKNVRRDIPFVIIASLVLFAITLGDTGLLSEGRIGRGDGVVMIILYVMYVWFSIRTTPRPEIRKAEQEATEQKRKRMPLWLALTMLIGGFAALIYGGDILVKGAIGIARRLNVSESIIALTIVAGGTSMPELASSVAFIIKRKGSMALGNILGSNVFNILFILGVSSTVSPLTMGQISIVDMSMMLLSSIAVFVTAFTFRGRAINRSEGIVFLAIYVAYVTYLITCVA